MISYRLIWICIFYLHIGILHSAFGVKLFNMLQTGAKKACGKLDSSTDTIVDQSGKAITYRCCLCGASSNSFQLLPTDEEAVQNRGKSDLNDSIFNTDNEVCFAILQILVILLKSSIIQCKSVIPIFELHTGMCSCFCIFQNSVCSTCCIRSTSDIRPYKVGYWSSSRTKRFVLVKHLASLQATLDSTDSYASRFYCFYALISRTGGIYTRSNWARAVAEEASFPQGVIDEVSTNVVLELTCGIKVHLHVHRLVDSFRFKIWYNMQNPCYLDWSTHYSLVYLFLWDSWGAYTL